MSEEQEKYLTREDLGVFNAGDKLLLNMFKEQFRPPECCFNCQHLESEYCDFNGELIFMCSVNVRFPRKKLACKRQKPKKEKRALQ